METTSLEKYSDFTAWVSWSTLLAEVADALSHVEAFKAQHADSSQMPESTRSAVHDLNTFRPVFNTVCERIQRGELRWEDYAEQHVTESILSLTQRVRLSLPAEGHA